MISGWLELVALWKHAVQSPKKSDPGKQADKKNRKKRREYKKKQLQTGELFVLSPGHFVGIQGKRIVVRQKQKIITEVPVAELQSITLSNRALSVSTNVLQHCATNDIPFHIIDGFGNITAVLHRPDGASAFTSPRCILL